jgi:hypothetical protein
MTGSTRHRTVRARRRSADRGRARPRLEGLEDRCVLSTTLTEFCRPARKASPGWIAAGGRSSPIGARPTEIARSGACRSGWKA